MRRKLVIPVLLVGLAALSMQVIFAGKNPYGVSLRAGALFPTKKETRDKTGETLFVGGIDWRFYNINFGYCDPCQSAHLSLSADIYTKSSKHRNIPVLINLVGQSGQFFYSAGVGVGFGRIINRTLSTNNNCVFESKTNFAYRLGVGWEFCGGKNPWFVEGAYYGSGKTELNGAAVLVGVRI